MRISIGRYDMRSNMQIFDLKKKSTRVVWINVNSAAIQFKGDPIKRLDY